MTEPSHLQAPTIHKSPLSVGKVAKICHVSKKTVLNWIYRGAIKTFTTFGGHYRIWPGDLAEFIIEQGMDIQFNFTEKRLRHVLIIENQQPSIDKIKKTLRLLKPTAVVTTTDDGHHAMYHLGKDSPLLIIANTGIPDLPLAKILLLLADKKRTLPPTIMLGVRQDNRHHIHETTKEISGVNILISPQEAIDIKLIAHLRKGGM